MSYPDLALNWFAGLNTLCVLCLKFVDVTSGVCYVALPVRLPISSARFYLSDI